MHNPRAAAQSPTADWLDRLAALPVAARLSEIVASFAGTATLLFHGDGEGIRLAGAARSSCVALRERELWPRCLPPPLLAPLQQRQRCSAGRGLHLAVPVRERGEIAGYLVTGELEPESPGEAAEGRLHFVEQILLAIADEMQRSLDRSAACGQRQAAREPPRDALPELVGEDPAFELVRTELRRACEVGYPVLLLGESGTGKDLVASLLHHRGPRRHKEMVSLNCAALPEQLLESELFGHRRGAFTGADRDKPGLFEVARGGTLFLDEIQQISLGAQAKLLRAVDTGEFLPLGGVRAARSDARLVVATNAPIEQLVSAGTFRADLFYRLSVLTIRLPPLRTVRGDLPALARHFARLICERERLGQRTISLPALAALVAAPWPGNVRQLIHELERALLRCAGNEIRLEHLSPELQETARGGAAFDAQRARISQAWEREELRRGLLRTSWNVSLLARELGLSRRGLTGKLQRLGLRRGTP